jgi:hypothetical protein
MMMVPVNAQPIPVPPVMAVTPPAMAMVSAPMTVMTNLDHVALRKASIHAQGFSDYTRADIRGCRTERSHEACKQNAKDCYSSHGAYSLLLTG